MMLFCKIRCFGGCIAGILVSLLVPSCTSRPTVTWPAASRRADARKKPEDSVAFVFDPLAKSYGRNDALTFTVQNRSSQTFWVYCNPEVFWNHPSRGAEWISAEDEDFKFVIYPQGFQKIGPSAQKHITWKLHDNFDFFRDDASFWNDRRRRCRIRATILPGPRYNPVVGREDPREFDVCSPEINIIVKH